MRTADKQLTKDARVMLGDPRRALRMMALPMLVSLLVAQVNSFVDTFWCSSLGAIPLAAVGLVASFYLIISGIGSGVGIGISASIAAKVAMKRKEEADAVASQSIVFMAVIGLIITPITLAIGNPIIRAVGGAEMYDDCVSYALPFFLGAVFIVMQGILAGILRGEGASRRAMAMMASAAVLNIVFDPLFTFVLGWGIAGLAWATIAATALSAIPFFYWYLLRSDTTYVDIHRSMMRPQRPVLRDLLSVGIPKTIELDIMATMNFPLNFFVVAAAGAEGFAVYATSWKFVELMLVPSVALASALVPICAAAFQRKDLGKMRFTYAYAMAWALAITAAEAVLLCILTDHAVVMFTYSDGSIGLRGDIIHVTRVFMIIGVLYSAINISSSLLQSMRMANSSMWSTFIRNVVLLLTFAFCSAYDLNAICWGFVACEVFGMFLMVGWAEAGFRMRKGEVLRHSSGSRWPSPPADVRTVRRIY